MVGKHREKLVLYKDCLLSSLVPVTSTPLASRKELYAWAFRKARVERTLPERLTRVYVGIGSSQGWSVDANKTAKCRAGLSFQEEQKRERPLEKAAPGFEQHLEILDFTPLEHCKRRIWFKMLLRWLVHLQFVTQDQRWRRELVHSLTQYDYYTSG